MSRNSTSATPSKPDTVTPTSDWSYRPETVDIPPIAPPIIYSASFRHPAQFTFPNSLPMLPVTPPRQRSRLPMPTVSAIKPGRADNQTLPETLILLSMMYRPQQQSHCLSSVQDPERYDVKEWHHLEGGMEWFWIWGGWFSFLFSFSLLLLGQLSWQRW